MRLYEWREDSYSNLLQFKYIGSKFSLPSLNAHFSNYIDDKGDMFSRKYPLLNNNSMVNLGSQGQCLVFYDDGTYIFVVDLDHPQQVERSVTLRDFKINLIRK